MRAERERELSRLIWKERITRSAAAVFAAVAIFGAYVFLTYERTRLVDVTVETAKLDGTVISTAPGLTGKSMVVHVRLDNGLEIDATSYLKLQPVPGAHAEVRMARHQSGRVTYNVAKVD